ncbi:polycystic kidney disease 1-like 3 [Paracidovorax konjaci]|uniref:Uncharacterized protein n=1 Tax=Paracidovorax konjaci TaxID=32040 RepID=A0A1I1SF84_9BURK|nr:polycystic kidney disease 1-like 3 [Paracidovorax konjaci]SFD45144.1 hypothetical protein SAMN04489710_102178 [Paracidovorax konjaci]
MRRNPAPIPLEDFDAAIAHGTSGSGNPPAWAAIARDDIPVDYRSQSASLAGHRQLASGPAIGRDNIQLDYRATAGAEAAWQDLFDPDTRLLLGLDGGLAEEESHAASPWTSPLGGDTSPQPSPQAPPQPLPKRIDLRNAPHATIASLPEQDIRGLAVACRLLPQGAQAGTEEVVHALREHLKRVDFGVFSEYDRMHVLNMPQDALLHAALSSSDRDWLARLAEKTHMTIRQERIEVPGRDGPLHRIGIYFDGLPDEAPQQSGTTLKGGVGRVYRLACEAAAMIAKALADRDDVEVSPLCGLSLGGGSAQMFAATLQAHAPHLPPPALTLLDPMLLSRAQMAHAVKDAPHAYDFKQPRGIAISLDYAAAPRKSLMDRLHGVGLSTAGLVRLRLGLTDQDGLDGTRPKPYGPIGTGYHANRHHYDKAMQRFLGPDVPARR